MEKMDKLKHILCEELDNIADKKQLSAGDLETVHTLTDTVKNILKIKMLEDESGYSGDGRWQAGGSYANGSYAQGRSYADDDMSYARGGRRRSYGSYNGGYSAADARQDMKMIVGESMGDLDPQARKAAERFLQELNK